MGVVGEDGEERAGAALLHDDGGEHDVEGAVGEGLLGDVGEDLGERSSRAVSRTVTVRLVAVAVLGVGCGVWLSLRRGRGGGRWGSLRDCGCRRRSRCCSTLMAG